MDGNSQTSFIPKKPINNQSSSYPDHGVSIVTILAVIVFFGSVALAAGSYIYHGLLEKKLIAKKETLEKEKANFDLETIRALKRMDIRIESSKALLDQHIAASAFFDVLESATLKTVRFNDLEIKTQNNTSVGGAAVNDNPLIIDTSSTAIEFRMTGAAKTFTSIALQSDLFSKTKGFKEPIFSNINRTESDEIGFVVTALLDPQVLRYRTLMNLENADLVSPPPASVQPPAPESVFNPTGQ